MRKAGFRDIADPIVCNQRFIATMQGRTANLSTFSDAQFDEAAFEAQLTDDRIARWSAGTGSSNCRRGSWRATT